MRHPVLHGALKTVETAIRANIGYLAKLVVSLSLKHIKIIYYLGRRRQRHLNKYTSNDMNYHNIVEKKIRLSKPNTYRNL